MFPFWKQKEPFLLSALCLHAIKYVRLFKTNKIYAKHFLKKYVDKESLAGYNHKQLRKSIDGDKNILV